MTLLAPTAEQQRRIDEELPFDREMEERSIAAIREWLAKQPHLPDHMEDERLGNFLFGCKNSVERCKEILERYYSARTILEELFESRDPLARDIQECCDAVYYFPLPTLTKEGHRVTIFRLRNTDIDKFSMKAIVRRTLMVMDLRLLEERCLSNVMVIDTEGLSVAHIGKCSPTQPIMRRGMLATQDSMPFRLARVHFINAPAFIGNIVNVFFPLLKPKLVQKFRIDTTGAEALYPYMDRDILPNEWGGKAGTFQQLNDAWRKKIESRREWFLREEKMSRTKESARPPSSKPSIFTELEGVQGSFRKLNID